jgi:3'-phosphoadenosine 5'-phosphosulfate sulfotransferase (PAPS reductase)/FAD synthetase
MYDQVFARHQNVALQFSGGKDSLAVLYLMRPYWDKLTVYYCNSGNAFPETLDLIAKVVEQVPRFVEVKGRQPQVNTQLGWPSDLVTCGSTWAGRMMGSNEPALIDRYTCCFKSLMEPMYQRMKADKITLIIRGQKNADPLKPPLRSGHVSDGFEFLYPIEDWDDEYLFAYLQSCGTRIPRYYKDGMTSAPDCMNCTAWLEHKMPAYVKRYHPTAYPELQNRLNKIAVAVKPYMDELQQTQEQ